MDRKSTARNKSSESDKVVEDEKGHGKISDFPSGVEGFSVSQRGKSEGLRLARDAASRFVSASRMGN